MINIQCDYISRPTEEMQTGVPEGRKPCTDVTLTLKITLLNLVTIHISRLKTAETKCV